MRGVAAAMFALLVLAGFVSAGALLVLAAIGSAGPREAAESPAVGARPRPAAPEPAAPAFAPFWVKNHRITEMWSGRAGAGGVVSFGTTSAQFCSFLVVRPPDNGRLHVFNPFSENYFWIDAAAVGPVGPPESMPERKPADQNCAGPVHEQ